MVTKVSDDREIKKNRVLFTLFTFIILLDGMFAVAIFE